MLALALLISYQGVLAWLTVDYMEGWLIYAGLAAVIAAALSLVESRGAQSRTLLAFILTLGAGAAVLVLYGFIRAPDFVNGASRVADRFLALSPR